MQKRRFKHYLLIFTLIFSLDYNNHLQVVDVVTVESGISKQFDSELSCVSELLHFYLTNGIIFKSDNCSFISLKII